MAGLVPAIHVLSAKNVDARHEAGHDEPQSPLPDSNFKQLGK